eukprot:scaffold7520_cov229-Pinguiococcus_pyrenoidosus.AAC.4
MALLLARQARRRYSKHPSKPWFPGAGSRRLQTLVFSTSIGKNGRSCCMTTSLCAHALPNSPPQMSLSFADGFAFHFLRSADSDPDAP